MSQNMRLILSRAGAIAALALCVPLPTQALSSYPARLPSTVPQGGGCVTCHFNPGGGGARNPFGVAFAANGRAWSAALAGLDSDNDGASNGAELGDPTGMWSSGQARPAYVSAPGDATSTPPPPCGNGQIDAGEQCDGANLDGKTCADFGGAAGQPLSCNSQCQLVTTGCDPCGNGQLDAGEQCDGAKLDGKTCADFGGVAGQPISCDSQCQLVTSSCMAPQMDMGMSDMGGMTDMGSMTDMGDPVEDMGGMTDMGGTTDMGAVVDMGGMTDMGAVVDMGAAEDMGATDRDMSVTPTQDMGAAQDMGTTPTQDMGATQDMGTTPTPVTPKADDDGCFSSTTGQRAPAAPLALMGMLLGLFAALRRRR